MTFEAVGVEVAKQLVVEHARMLGLKVLDAHVLRDSHNVLVHLRPSPVVARVGHVPGMPRDTRAHMRNEVRVGRYLADRGARVVPPSGSIDPWPHEIGRTVVSYWTYVESQGTVDPLLAGRALARCHALMRDADLRLAAPGGDPRLEALAIFAELSDGGALDPARGRRVVRLAEEDLEATEALDLRKQSSMAMRISKTCSWTQMGRSGTTGRMPSLASLSGTSHALWPRLE